MFMWGRHLARQRLGFHSYLWLRTCLDQHLAQILARKKTHERLGSILDPVDDGLLPHYLAFRNPVAHVGVKLLVPLFVIGGGESTESQTLGN